MPESAGEGYAQLETIKSRTQFKTAAGDTFWSPAMVSAVLAFVPLLTTMMTILHWVPAAAFKALHIHHVPVFIIMIVPPHRSHVNTSLKSRGLNRPKSVSMRRVTALFRPVRYRGFIIRCGV